MTEGVAYTERRSIKRCEKEWGLAASILLAVHREAPLWPAMRIKIRAKPF